MDTTTIATRRRGVVRFFNSAKGYGFIGRTGGRDLFMHREDLAGNNYRTLEPGQRVEYEVVSVGGRLKAANVVPLESEVR